MNSPPPAPAQSEADLALVADIGGTNARFALADLSAPTPRLLQARSLPGVDFASVRHAAEHYLDGADVRPRRAAFAVASSAGAGEEVRLTNRAWSFIREELRAALGLDELHVLNDFGAVAWAVPALRAGERKILYGPADAPLTGPVSVLGPGTGLGVALLVGSPDDGWQVLETEGGHVGFAPQDGHERVIADRLAALHGRVSNERLLCGDGLSRIDAIARGVPVDAATSLREPAQIVTAALKGHDAAAHESLARFCAVLGSVAGDIALAHGARSVVIAGGMAPRFLPFLRASAFRERFIDKGRFAAYLEPVAIQVITHPHPGLLGAALALRGQGPRAVP